MDASEQRLAQIMAVVNIMNLVQSLFAAVWLVKAQIPVTQVRIHPSNIRYRVGLLFMHKNSDFGAIWIFFFFSKGVSERGTST